MKAFLIIENGHVQQTGYSSLKAACSVGDVSYASAIKGKRVWAKKDGSIVMIREIEIQKTKRKPNKQ